MTGIVPLVVEPAAAVEVPKSVEPLETPEIVLRYKSVVPVAMPA